MILDTLENSSLYEGLHPSFPQAFAWLKKFDPSTPDGRYEIDGQKVVAILQSYQTAPADEKKWETHRVHGDIQVIYAGEELVGHALRDQLVVRTPYNPAKDAEFYEPPRHPFTLLNLSEGYFAVFYPHDAHQPGVMMEEPVSVLKVVVKFCL